MNIKKWSGVITAYSIIYTVITLLSSVLYLANGIYEDPSGNWHELDRAIILLIGFCLVQWPPGSVGKNCISGYLDKLYRPLCTILRHQYHHHPSEKQETGPLKQ